MILHLEAMKMICKLYIPSQGSEIYKTCIEDPPHDPKQYLGATLTLTATCNKTSDLKTLPPGVHSEFKFHTLYKVSPNMFHSEHYMYSVLDYAPSYLY